MFYVDQENSYRQSEYSQNVEQVEYVAHQWDGFDIYNRVIFFLFAH